MTDRNDCRATSSGSESGSVRGSLQKHIKFKQNTLSPVVRVSTRKNKWCVQVNNPNTMSQETRCFVKKIRSKMGRSSQIGGPVFSPVVQKFSHHCQCINRDHGS